MSSFTLRHEIACTPDRFWELFLDDEVQKRVFADLSFSKWEVVEHTETEKEVVRIVKAVPKLDAPGPVAKVLGPGFGYTEEGRFDKASKVFRFTITPTALADKLRNEGTVKCEPKGADACTRIVEIVAEAKIFAIGSAIEKMTEKNMRDGWGRSADFFNALLKKGA